MLRDLLFRTADFTVPVGLKHEARSISRIALSVSRSSFPNETGDFSVELWAKLFSKLLWRLVLFRRVFGRRFGKIIFCLWVILRGTRGAVNLLALLGRKLRRITLISAVRVDLLVPYVWGVESVTNQREAGFVFLEQLSEDLFRPKTSEPLKLALLLDDRWYKGSSFDTKSVAEFQRRGWMIFDAASFRMSLWGIIHCIRAVDFSAVRSLGFGFRIVAVIEALIAVIKEAAVFENIDPRISIGRDDYDVRHVARSILLKSRNRLSFGLQHSTAGCIWDLPMHAFVAFDRYLVMGCGFVKHWRSYWRLKSTQFVVTGPHRSFMVPNNAAATIKNRVLIVAGPPEGSFRTVEQSKIFWSGFRDTVFQFPESEFVIRYRSRGSLLKAIDLIGAEHLCLDLPNVTIANSESTQSLLRTSTVLVTEDASSLILEACYVDNLLILSAPVSYQQDAALSAIPLSDLGDLRYILPRLESFELDDCARSFREQVLQTWLCGSVKNCWPKIQTLILKTLI